MSTETTDRPTRTYNKRSKSKRVASKFDETLNLARNLTLSDADREALARVEEIKARAMAAAERDEIKPSKATLHPMLISLLEEQKSLRKEIRSAEIRERRLRIAEIEADCYRENQSYRDEMFSWVESAIETVRAQIDAGQEPQEPERPNVSRVDVARLVEQRVGAYKNSLRKEE